MVDGAFVPVALVLVMKVTVVDVVHMIAVGDGRVAAIRAVYVGMTRMGTVNGRRRAGTHGLIVAERSMACRPRRNGRRRPDAWWALAGSEGEDVGVDVRPALGSPSDQVHDPTETRVLVYSSGDRDDDRGAGFRSHQDQDG